MSHQNFDKVIPISNTNYASVVYDLKDKLKKAQNDKEKLKIYSEFCQNYLMFQSLWKERYTLETKQLHRIFNIYKEGLYQFNYSSKLKFIKDFIQKKVVKIKIFKFGHVGLFEKDHSELLKILENLTFPLNILQRCLMRHEEFSSSPLPKKLFVQVEKLEKLYWKIKKAEKNLEEWLECLKEANDHDFVKQNVEFRIGENLNNKKLWKLYISYLRETDPKEMLQVYSKYCRFFLNDFEMKNEYKNATEKYGQVFVPWKNAFTFENQTLWNLRFPEEREEQKVNIKSIKSFKRREVNLEVSSQRWEFPLPFIRCMIDIAKPQMMSKLQQTCKYFYFKNPKLYCYRFFYEPSKKNADIKERSLLLTPKSKHTTSTTHFQVKKLSITTSFMFINSPDNTLSLSEILKTYVLECDAKYLHISNQNITEIEFKILVGRGNVEPLVFISCHIFDSKNKPYKLETILNLFSKIRKFCICPDLLSPISTNNELSKLKLKNKLVLFRIEHINNFIDDTDFCDFVKKNAAPSAEFNLSFHVNVDKALIKPMKKAVKSMLDEWKPSKMKPVINIWVK